MAANGNDIEKRLWAAADQLWANTGLKPAEFSAPVLGLIFLRYAEKRFAQAEARVGAIGSGGRRKIGKTDYQAEGVIFLRPEARFSYLLSLPEAVGGAYEQPLRRDYRGGGAKRRGRSLACRPDTGLDTAQHHLMGRTGISERSSLYGPRPEDTSEL